MNDNIQNSLSAKKWLDVNNLNHFIFHSNFFIKLYIEWNRNIN